MTTPFGPENLFRGKAQGTMASEYEIYEVVKHAMADGECPQRALDLWYPLDSHSPETYHRARITAALTGDDRAAVEADRMSYIQRRLEHRIAKRGPMAQPKKLIKSWTDGCPTGVTEAVEEGYAIVRRIDGSRELWQLNQCQEFGPDPDVLRRAKPKREELERKRAWLAEHENDTEPEWVVELVAKTKPEVDKLQREVDQIEQVEAWAWCRDIADGGRQ